jgi:hypothetical protein
MRVGELEGGREAPPRRHDHVGLAGAAAAWLGAFVSVVLAGVEELDFSGLLDLVDSATGAFGEEYKSEYQPPPLRMKFVPPLIRRRASDFIHLGHRTAGGSEMR